MWIYTTFLYQPILNVFVGLYHVIPDVGVVIIILTLLVRLILYPFYKTQIKAQKAMQDLQPKLNEVKEQYKDDKEGQAKAMMELYKEQKVNPFSSCLPVLIQLPIFFAVYRVLRDGLTNVQHLDLLYPFIPQTTSISPMFLGLVDLAHPNAILAIIAGLAQFWQGRMLVQTRPTVKGGGSKDEDAMAMMNKQMTYLMPVMITIFGFALPSGLALYWIVTTLFLVAQQYIAFRHDDKKTTRVDEKTDVISNA